ncbi:phosphatidylinositol alpha 1,6-mannosyltransferase [Haloechinothrix alba]|uniref:Phosphatidylinositol alpha 1,6-mannosyltransferase n=1 Tax=Haloechinothrix alba TaxID=664784 RepID=A0A238YF71_9PSEU|nr:glycosyltransferase family 1 protein [Haloechinothrix alba]SNR69875.1 phosphatidylinositol alpha 1,6-mannosyltransferase [Haloechinothrix alba]
MRIAIVTESFLPQVNGVTNSVLRVLEHLRAAGHRTLVIAPGSGMEWYGDTRVVRLPAVQLPAVKSLPVGLPTRALDAALEEFGPDVVHLASPFVVGARGAQAARRLGVPSVAVYQTDVAGFADSYGLGFARRAAWRWIRRLHSTVDRTLAPSTESARQLHEHGVPRVHLWRRGVDVSRFSPELADRGLRAALAPHGELLVGFVGRLAPEKEVDRLAALENVPGVRLVVVGDGPAREALRRRMPGAAFLGARYGDELAAVYASLDVFVHTGPHETFCQTVQEAMASGVPVLAPAAGGPMDLVRDGVTGYLLPVERGAFRAALLGRIDQLADDRSRAGMGARGRATVRARTWQAVCAELLVHYGDVTGSPVSPGGDAVEDGYAGRMSA